MDRSSCHSYFQHFFAWAFSLMKANFYPRVYGGRKWLVLLIPSRRERWEPTAIIPQSIKKVPLFCARRLPKCVSQPPRNSNPVRLCINFFCRHLYKCCGLIRYHIPCRNDLSPVGKTSAPISIKFELLFIVVLHTHKCSI